MYNDIPQYGDDVDDVVWEGRRGSAYGEGVRRERRNDDDYDSRDSGYPRPKRSSTWQDDYYDQPQGNSGRPRAGSGFDDDYVYRDNPSSGGKPGPGRPAAPKPMFAAKTGSLRNNEAVAMFTFDADQPGDLGFKKGDVITVTKKTEKAEDWWTGTLNGKTGIFPSNYVKMKE